MDRSDSTTFRYLRERMAAEAKVIEAAIAPPPPAEQASGEHVEALTKLREREWETADAFGRLDAKWFSRQEAAFDAAIAALRSEEHTSELQSLMRISYAVFCSKKNNRTESNNKHTK